MGSVSGLMLALASLTAAQESVKLPVVSYAELGRLVREQRGKVVVVYFYANFCTPCKVKGLPALSKMHEKYADAGLMIFAVNIDKVTDTKAKAALEEYLTEKIKPKYRTLTVDTKTFDYDEKISKEGVPAAFVFDRENRWAMRLPALNAAGDKVVQDVDYDVIEKTVAGLLEKKGEK